ncbi:hypothetical protein [Gorillibacterium massiliense]|uniref:hypothetical protein n=1 Tax=Gorillibacterium massiliense TaxID=1280390 RepID=UPI0004AFD396|nr:hypothetical protein [Gorillibacterium massiliense]
MEWTWSGEAPAALHISGVDCRTQDGSSILTWDWPGSLRYVFLYGYAPGTGGVGAQRLPESGAAGMKLYTREEYKANGGFRERIDRIGFYRYIIFPCVRQEGELLVYRQTDGENEVAFSLGKAVIRCSIEYSGGWLGRRRTARMTVSTEVPVPKETLCYVKKAGSLPLSIDDGVRYPLLFDLSPGRNRLPDIEIGRDDCVKLFFTDGKAYGGTFDLIHGS